MISPTEFALAIRRPAGRMGMGAVTVIAPGVGVDDTSGAQVIVDPTLPLGALVDTGSSQVGPIVSVPGPKKGMSLTKNEKIAAGVVVSVPLAYGLYKLLSPRRRGRR